MFHRTQLFHKTERCPHCNVDITVISELPNQQIAELKAAGTYASEVKLLVERAEALFVSERAKHAARCDPHQGRMIK